jgi:hypothetical protein
MPPRKRKQLEVDSARGGGIEAEHHAAAKRVAAARVALIDAAGVDCVRLDRVRSSSHVHDKAASKLM